LLRKLYKYLPVVLLVLLGCGEDEGIRPSDAEYFPLRKGFYQVYSVHSIHYLAMTKVEDVTYQLKTEVIDSFVNEQGGYTYTIHRSRRNTESDPWQFQQLWSVRMTSTSVVVYEENIPFIKIVFPAIENRRWDGNALNNLEKDEYTLTSSGDWSELEPEGPSGQFIRIVQEDAFDIITMKDQREEVYVRNVGLVYREIDDVVYCSTEGQCEIGAQVIDNGTIYVQTLISYGQN